METPKQKLVYAVGDVHGRLDLLGQAFDAIRAHQDGAEGQVVFLGDYVDRGPNSRGVVELLMRAEREGALTCLKGNHEQIMVEACRSGELGQWLVSGGRETLSSYGGQVEDIPAAHLDWMDSRPVVLTDPHRVYVHAGLMPGVALDRQSEQTCLWIRDRFLDAGGPEAFPDGKHVVHGHTPVWRGKPDPSKPELLSYRTNLDTGAFATGLLTVGVFDLASPGGPIDVIQVGGVARSGDVAG